MTTDAYEAHWHVGITACHNKKYRFYPDSLMGNDVSFQGTSFYPGISK